jgi:hypothetical protein
MKNVKKWMWGLAALLVFNLSACTPDDNVASEVVVNSDFEKGTDGWTGGYAEYSTSMEGKMEFDLTRTNLPSPLDQSRMAMKIEGRNLSDNMFMFMKKKISGLDPDLVYEIVYEIDLASNYANNSVGIGGSPATSVYLKGGASPDEPVKYLKKDYYYVTIDKGVQSRGGSEMHVLGHVGAGDNIKEHKIIERTNAQNPVMVKPDSNGDLWLCVGTDSGFEGKTILFYDDIRVSIRPVNSGSL